MRYPSLALSEMAAATGSDGHNVIKNTRSPFRKINKRIESSLSKAEIANLADYLERLTKTFR
ncbi:MAG: hypothetical protein AB8B54_06995 [Sphingorhabdus sp.]